MDVVEHDDKGGLCPPIYTPRHPPVDGGWGKFKPGEEQRDMRDLEAKKGVKEFLLVRRTARG
jgi:hypothetical protein